MAVSIQSLVETELTFETEHHLTPIRLFMGTTVIGTTVLFNQFITIYLSDQRQRLCLIQSIYYNLFV